MNKTPQNSERKVVLTTILRTEAGFVMVQLISFRNLTLVRGKFDAVDISANLNGEIDRLG